jgi:hypothetical protein
VYRLLQIESRRAIDIYPDSEVRALAVLAVLATIVLQKLKSNVSLTSGPLSFQGAPLDEKEVRKMSDAFTRLALTGEPYNIGYQYGKRLASAIADNCKGHPCEGQYEIETFDEGVVEPQSLSH